MASGFLNREVTVSLASFDPVVMKREFVAFAKQSVAEAISSGQAPATYDTFVNNHPGPVESVTLPGPVVFVFNNWSAAIEAAVAELQRRVPRRTGRYAASFVVLVNQQAVTDFQNIPADAEIVILNRQPYSRRMETGGNKTGARHFELAKASFNRRYSGVFNAQVIYLNIAAGLIPGVPYVLRRSAGRRKWRQVGQPISYPALVITAA